MLKKLVFLFFLASISIVAGAQPQTRDAFIFGNCSDDGDVDTLETICTIPNDGYSSVIIQGAVATAAFTDFNVDLSNDDRRSTGCDSATYVNYYTQSSDYTTPTGYLHSVSADPTTWSTTEISLKIDGLEGVGCIRLQAAGTSSNPDISWRLQ